MHFLLLPLLPHAITPLWGTISRIEPSLWLLDMTIIWHCYYNIIITLATSHRITYSGTIFCWCESWILIIIWLWLWPARYHWYWAMMPCMYISILTWMLIPFFACYSYVASTELCLMFLHAILLNVVCLLSLPFIPIYFHLSPCLTEAA